MKLILRDVLLILRVCISTVEHFRLTTPQPPTPPKKRKKKCGNHEIALIRPANNPLVSSDTLDPNGDEKKNPFN